MSDVTDQLPYYLVLTREQVSILEDALEEAVASFDNRVSEYEALDNQEMVNELEGRAFDTYHLLDHVVGTTSDTIYPATDTEVAA